MSHRGQSWALNLTSSEGAIINLLLNSYSTFEAKLRELSETPSRASTPKGMIADALVLLRCLVFRRLEEHQGKFVKIERAV